MGSGVRDPKATNLAKYILLHAWMLRSGFMFIVRVGEIRSSVVESTVLGFVVAMAMPGWLRWHWQWLVSGLLVALMVILYFVSTLLACCVLVAWIYVVGHKMMMNQAYPFSRPLGATTRRVRVI